MKKISMHKLVAIVACAILLMASYSFAEAPQKSARLCYHFTSLFTDDNVVLTIDNQKIFYGTVKTKRPGLLDFALEQCIDTEVGKQHSVEILINGKKFKQGVVMRQDVWVLVSQSSDKSSVGFTFTVQKPLYD